VDAQGFACDSLAHLVDEVGLAQEGSGHGHKIEPVVYGLLDGIEAVDAAEKDERHVKRIPELSGIGQKERFLEGIVRHEALAQQAKPHPDGRRQGGGELPKRHLAAEEVHRVGERAASGELEGIEEILRNGNGADRQLRVFNANRDIIEVVSEIADRTEVAAEPQLAK